MYECCILFGERNPKYGNNRWMLLKKIMSLTLVMALSYIFMASCSQKTNYETEKPFIVVTTSPAGEGDYRNFFTRNYSIYSSGKLILYTKANEKLNIDDDAPVFETQLESEKIEKLKKLIEKNKFWKLEEDQSDNDSADGTFHYITINLTDQSKTVGGLNPNNPNFTGISDYVIHLVRDEDYKIWEKTKQDYILKRNPS